MQAYAMSITPFDATGALDEALFRAHVRFLADAGLGVYVASQGSGEGDLLSFVEKVRCYELAVDEIAGRVPVVAAGIGLAGSTASIAELARAASATGVDAVQILGPRLGAMRPRPDELAAYFQAVAGAVDCDVHLSNNVVLTGYALPADLIDELLAAPVTVLNIADPRAHEVAALVDRFGSSAEIRLGVAAQLASNAVDGFLSFEANVAPQLVADACAAMQLEPLLALNAALARGGNPRSLKTGLRIIGRDGGALRRPYLPLDAEQTRELSEFLQNL
jgi:4-hydroxy-tetrahydrodipicolinate synthase